MKRLLYKHIILLPIIIYLSSLSFYLVAKFPLYKHIHVDILEKIVFFSFFETGGLKYVDHLYIYVYKENTKAITQTNNPKTVSYKTNILFNCIAYVKNAYSIECVRKIPELSPKPRNKPLKTIAEEGLNQHAMDAMQLIHLLLNHSGKVKGSFGTIAAKFFQNFRHSKREVPASKQVCHYRVKVLNCPEADGYHVFAGFGDSVYLYPGGINTNNNTPPGLITPGKVKEERRFFHPLERC